MMVNHIVFRGRYRLPLRQGAAGFQPATGGRSCKGSRGFTLVEMVVAVTILSLISLATLTGVRTLGDSQKKLEDVTQRLDQMRLVSDFLRNSLRQSALLGNENTGGGWSSWGRGGSSGTQLDHFFHGNEDELVWTTPLGGAAGAAGLQYAKLSREGGSLRIQFIPYRPETDELRWEKATSYPLVESLDEFSIEYRETLTSEWVQSWDREKTSMPRLVRVRIRAHDRYWPDIVVAPPHTGTNG